MRKFWNRFTRLGFLMAMTMLIVMGVPAVLTADVDIARKEGGLQSFLVGTDIIYKGALVCVNTDGYLVAAADTVGYRFVGVAYEKVDNSAGAPGAKSCRVYTKGAFLLTAVATLTQAMVGQLMYATNDGAVDDSASAFVCVGRLVEWVSTTSGWVDISQRHGDLDGSPDRKFITNIVHDEAGALDYAEGHIAGVPTGHIYGRGTWINIDDAAVPAAGLIIVPNEGGVYSGAAVMTNARVIFGAQYQAVITTPNTLYAWRLNCATPAGVPVSITALIAAGNPESVGYVAGSGKAAKGYIPLADIAGGVGVVYVLVYQ